MNEPSPEITRELVSIPNRFARWSAVFSLLAPFVVILIYIILFAFMQSYGRTRLTTMVAIGSLPLLLIISGIILGIFALTRIKRQEYKGLFGMALAGVFTNSLLSVTLFVGPYIWARTLSKDYPVTPQAKLAKANQRLAAAVKQEDRFYALDDAAKESFVIGKIEDARKYAQELLSLAPSFLNDWNYGNAIQDGNLVLGRIAVRDGKIEDAKQYLLAAAKSKGSPQMNSFGPNMSLAKDLLEKGERDTVLQYFELCRKFWTMDRGQLDDWSKEVKAGTVPDFGANLVY